MNTKKHTQRTRRSIGGKPNTIRARNDDAQWFRSLCRQREQTQGVVFRLLCAAYRQHKRDGTEDLISVSEPRITLHIRASTTDWNWFRQEAAERGRASWSLFRLLREAWQAAAQQ